MSSEIYLVSVRKLTFILPARWCKNLLQVVYGQIQVWMMYVLKSSPGGILRYFQSRAEVQCLIASPPAARLISFKEAMPHHYHFFLPWGILIITMPRFLLSEFSIIFLVIHSLQIYSLIVFSIFVLSVNIFRALSLFRTQCLFYVFFLLRSWKALLLSLSFWNRDSLFKFPPRLKSRTPEDTGICTSTSMRIHPWRKCSPRDGILPSKDAPKVRISLPPPTPTSHYSLLLPPSTSTPPPSLSTPYPHLHSPHRVLTCVGPKRVFTLTLSPAAPRPTAMTSLAR